MQGVIQFTTVCMRLEAWIWHTTVLYVPQMHTVILVLDQRDLCSEGLSQRVQPIWVSHKSPKKLLCMLPKYFVDSFLHSKPCSGNRVLKKLHPKVFTLITKISSSWSKSGKQTTWSPSTSSWIQSRCLTWRPLGIAASYIQLLTSGNSLPVHIRS